tara:strand:- start:1674 stop:1838 length:165 start_codon:yes stop_codon:yes gene_type:complete
MTSFTLKVVLKTAEDWADSSELSGVEQAAKGIIVRRVKRCFKLGIRISLSISER